MNTAQKLVPIISPHYNLIWTIVAVFSALLIIASVMNDVVRGRFDWKSFLVFGGYLVAAVDHLGILGGAIAGTAVIVECALIFEMPVYISRVPSLIKGALEDDRLDGDRKGFTIFLYVLTFLYRAAIVAILMADYFYAG